MLQSLSIQNYALIDSLHIRFDSGFSVISGETGAGKSIILGALSLILGQRADARHIKQGKDKCFIEGVFNISSYNLKSFFAENDWVYDGDECILRREIWTGGRSRAFVNDSPVYLNDLKSLGDRLIDVHSQHQSIALQDNRFQLNVIDALAGVSKERDDYELAFRDYKDSVKKLDEVKNRSRNNNEEKDYIQFQYNALKDAKLREGEQKELEDELRLISNAEEIKSGLYEVSSLLSGDGHSVEVLLRSASDILLRLRQVFPKLEDIGNRVEAAYIDIKDAGEEVVRYFEDIEFDADRQQLLEDRLDTIYALQKKHSVNDERGLIELCDDLGGRLQNIDSLDEQLALLEKDVSSKRSQLLLKVTALSKKREAVIPSMENKLVERLAYLKMPNTKFKCEFSTKDEPDITGIDTVQFVFSANKNSPLLPVAKIASGGEISRLMLCLKAMIAGATALPTIIFDEIDTGTSGEVADRVGSIMKEMSLDMQVIGITHLPQIASKGHTHFVVYKEELDDSVATRIKELSSSERVEEIARMLSGAKVTNEAMENARVMLS